MTDTPISKGSVIFCQTEWIEDEKYGWVTLSTDEVKSLSSSERDRFLRYSYDIDFGLSIGTFDWINVKHISNFMNHSCNPNIMYNNNDCIIARSDINAGDELTIDYGNFIVNFDQDFECNCGSEQCRKFIKKNDWLDLIATYGDNFPTFMKEKVNDIIFNLKSEK